MKDEQALVTRGYSEIFSKLAVLSDPNRYASRRIHLPLDAFYILLWQLATTSHVSSQCLLWHDTQVQLPEVKMNILVDQ